MKQYDAKYWVGKLQLHSHPEGGYFRETYRSQMCISPSALESFFDGKRNVSTAIYFLLDTSQTSAFHRIRSDELWHFHTGDSLIIHVIGTDGILKSMRLGPNPEAGDVFQLTVPAGCWFAAEVEDKTTYALCSCTVAPGFDFNDFELADATTLAATYPRYEELIFRMAGK